MKNSSLLFLLIILLTSCNKPEGEGGTSTITGKVIVKLCSDDFATIYATFPEEEKKVYIMYGDNEYFSDRVETHYDGSFRFPNLRKGDYKVYTYSDDESGESESGKIAIIKDIRINANGETVEAPVLQVYDQVSSYEGSSVIEGKIFAYDKNSDFTITRDSFYLSNEYVYISRLQDNYYFDRQRTYYDGSFVFTSLPQGKYEVYVYGRDSTAQGTQDEMAVIVIDSITANKQHIDLGRIDIII